MQSVRSEFPILATTNYLDVAHKASVPNAVARALREFYEDVQATGGDKHRWNEMLESTRAAAARLVGARPAEIAFVANTSQGLNFLAHGLRLAPGDNVVIGDQEHENNDFPWTHLGAAGLEVRRVRSAAHRFSVDDVAALVDARTRAVSLSHVYPASGFVPDLAAIATLCRARGAFLFVDAVQSLGALGTDVGALGIDGLATSGHKWLLGPYGAGFLYVGERFLASARPAFAAKLYSREDGAPFDTSQAPDARRWELGSPNYAGIHGLGASLRMLLDLGASSIESRIAELVGTLHEGARSRGIDVLDVTAGAGRTSGILALRVADAPAAAAALERERILVSARRGMLRVSLHFYNDESDVSGLLAAIADLA